jgi:hypothetical protein
MAYRKNFLEEEAQKNVAQGAAVGQNTLSPRSTTDQTSAVQAGQTTGTGAGANAPQTGPSPTGYIPLQQYLQANVGAGAGVKNVLSGQVEKAKTATETELAKTQSEAAAKAKEAASAIEKQGQEVIGGVTKSPTESLGQAKDFLSQTYTGPDVGTYAAQIGAAQKGAQQNLGLLESEAGKQAALESGLKGYRGGYGSLDRFLFAQDPTAKAAFEAERAKAKEAISSKASAAESAVKGEIESAQKKLEEQQKAVKETAGKTYEKGLGEAGKKILDLERRNIMKKGYQEASFGDVLTDQQKADLAALAELEGRGRSENLSKKTFQEGVLQEPTYEAGTTFERQAPGKMPSPEPIRKKTESDLQKLTNKLKLPKIKI